MFNAGVKGKRAKDTTGILTVGEHFNQQNFLIPTVTRFAVTDGSYVETDDIAAETTGNQTIVLYGSGFAPGATVLVGSTAIGAVTFLDSGRLAFSSPALGSGSYTIFVTNANGGTGILVPGLVYSGVPTFTTSAGSLGSVYETTAINTTIVATGDAPITYALASGSLPSGSTLSSGGTISGTAPVDGSSTTYSFTVRATDVDNQDSVRSFSLTINTDVVSFSSPANNTTYTATQNTAISNVTIAGVSAAGYGVLYTTSGLPTGLSMNTSTGIISGTPTVAPATNVSIITATANTTNRSATLYLNWTINLPGDLFWKYASLLLSANSEPNKITFITDSGAYNNDVVVVADTKPSEFHPFKEGYYSNYFDGNGDYLQITANTNIDLPGDFTIEAWVYPTGTKTTSDIIASRWVSGATIWLLTYDNTTKWTFQVNGSALITYNSTIIYNTWYHVAVTRLGTSVTMWLNGVSVGTGTSSFSLTSATRPLLIGRNADSTDGTQDWLGYISNFRIVKGTSLYNTAFTPSSAPLTYVANTSLLTCQSNRLIDTSNNNFTITKNGDVAVSPFIPFNGTPTTVTVPDANNYSVYFDGTGDYFTTPSSQEFAFGTGDFTIECWVYFTDAATARVISVGGSDNLNIERLVTSGYLTVYDGSGHSTTSVMNPFTWYHVALTRNSGTARLFLNGTLVLSWSSSVSYNSSTFYIGYNPNVPLYMMGYISNFRVLKGTALYTSSFTPSTSPLTVIANTSLLTAQANTVIDKSNNALTLTTNGNVTPTRNAPFANTTTVTLIGNEGSAYFDGTGDYLNIPATPAIDLATGAPNWTVELWFYASSFASAPTLIQKDGNSGTIQPQYNINLGTTGTINGTLSPATSSTGNQNFNSTAVASLNTWNHVAMVRNGNNLSIYLNGALVVGPTAITVTMGNNTRPLTIGANNPGANYFTGYISNVRITKGTAVYTSPFVPTWSPLTPIANTVLLTAQTNTSSNTKSFVDESNFNNIITPTGNTALGSFSPFGSEWSVNFDGTNDYIAMPTSSSFNFGTGDFTVECWVYWNSTTTDRGIISRYASASSGWALRYDTNGLNWINGDTTILAAAHTPVGGTWYHYAACRSGSTLRLFINGTQSANTTYSGNQDNSSSLYIGQLSNTLWPLNGYISNVRILKGTALYTSSFTPSINPLLPVANTVLLTCNSNKFVDYSAANNFITRTGDVAVSKFSPFSPIPVTPVSYSGYFDGTGDYLSSTGAAAANFGTGDFTFETWLYITVAINNNEWTIFEAQPASGAFQLYKAATTNLLMYGSYGVGGNQILSSASIPLSRWFHVAISRSGSGTNNVSTYVDGVRVAQFTDTTNYSATGITIGGRNTGANYFTGYISNMRAVKGTALYSGTTITVPTSPLTAIANTSLLTCQSTTFIDNSANTFAITVNGDAKPVIQNPFTDTVGVATNYSANTYGSSIFFDSYVAASVDYLSVSGIPISTTGQFTFEAWIYVIQVNSADAQMIYSQYNTTDANRWTFNITTANKLAVTHPSLTVTGATTIVPFQWNHVAVTRDSSNTLRIFLNGVADATSASYTYSIFQSPARVGYYNNTPNDYFNGYMSNVRVVNGQALYTGPFIPPNQSLLPTANTKLLLASTVGPSSADATRNHNIETGGTTRQVANNSPYYDTYSGYFDGTGDYLTFGANQANLGLGTEDFTFEFWFNAATIPSTEIDIFESQTNNSFRILKRASSAGLSFDPYGGTATLIMADASITTNTWHHVAVSRTSGTTSAYYDGTRVVNQADSTNYAAPVANYGVGGRASGANYLNGYISNMRLIKGTGLYSGTTITVPTSPLTAVANTQLLICNKNRFIDESNNAFTITKAGDARISAFEPFVGSNNSRYNSVYFGTKTDYLAIRPQPNLTTFPGDFTFECWVYPTNTTLSTNWGIWDSRNAGASTVGMIFSLNALASPVSGSWRMSYYNGTNYYGTGTVLWNQWSHLAWVRSGTTMTFYVNGVAGGTATISGTQTGTASGAPIFIGTKDNGLANYGTIGYIADLRITNGYARTITVPTAPYDIK